jgi:hypothetical protein
VKNRQGVAGVLRLDAQAQAQPSIGGRRKYTSMLTLEDLQLPVVLYRMLIILSFLILLALTVGYILYVRRKRQRQPVMNASTPPLLAVDYAPYPTEPYMMGQPVQTKTSFAI